MVFSEYLFSPERNIFKNDIIKVKHAENCIGQNSRFRNRDACIFSAKSGPGHKSALDGLHKKVPALFNVHFEGILPKVHFVHFRQVFVFFVQIRKGLFSRTADQVSKPHSLSRPSMGNYTTYYLNQTFAIFSGSHHFSRSFLHFRRKRCSGKSGKRTRPRFREPCVTRRGKLVTVDSTSSDLRVGVRRPFSKRIRDVLLEV